MVLTNACFSFGWVPGFYMADYTNGEVIYQAGAMLGYMMLFIAARWDAKHWAVKLVLNWIIEVYIISLWFTIFHNPYAMNWDKMLFLQISVSCFIIILLLHYLFPAFRRFKLF